MKTLYSIIDTETTNTTTQPIPYNIAMDVIDNTGKRYEGVNFLIKEVFCDMPDLMASAYYAKKIPQYLEQLERGEIELVSLAEAVKRIRDMIVAYNVKVWMAHNARFDHMAMQNVQRYVTKSKFRYLLPYGMTAWDTMKMAQDVVATKPTYRKFCEENGFMTKHRVPRPQVKAETLYRFITQDVDFVEEHKAHEDIEIEAQIFAYCIKQHKKMRRNLWKNEG